MCIDNEESSASETPQEDIKPKDEKLEEEDRKLPPDSSSTTPIREPSPRLKEEPRRKSGGHSPPPLEDRIPRRFQRSSPPPAMADRLGPTRPRNPGRSPPWRFRSRSPSPSHDRFRPIRRRTRSAPRFRAASDSLARACKYLADKHGETANECADAYFHYGKTLLELGRMEAGVLGNALQGVPDCDDESYENIEAAEKMNEEEKEDGGVKVMEALEENFEIHEEKISELLSGHTKRDCDDDEDEDDMEDEEETHHDEEAMETDRGRSFSRSPHRPRGVSLSPPPRTSRDSAPTKDVGAGGYTPSAKRPRCRDYDEKGFCLRGDMWGAMCEFDHSNDATPGIPFPPPQSMSVPPTGYPPSYLGKRPHDGGGYAPPAKRFDFNRLGERGRGGASSMLAVRNIPPELNTITHLNGHFGRYGTLVNVQIRFEGDPTSALVAFQGTNEAEAAFNTAEAVMNNRFIKVDWHMDKTKEGIGKPVDNYDGETFNYDEEIFNSQIEEDLTDETCEFKDGYLSSSAKTIKCVEYINVVTKDGKVEPLPGWYDNGASGTSVYSPVADRLFPRSDRKYKRNVIGAFGMNKEVEGHFYKINTVGSVDGRGRDFKKLIYAFGVDYMNPHPRVNFENIKDLFSLYPRGFAAATANRPFGEVQLMIGMNHAGVHPVEHLTKDNLKLMRSYYGTGYLFCGNHPDLDVTDATSVERNR